MAKLRIASLVIVSLTLAEFSVGGPNAAGASALQPSNSSKAASEAFAFSNPGPGLLALSYQGHRLLVYASATNQFKPYVRELYTLRGDNVLLDAPPDHLHHHGLMYAIRVNGNNFWEERDQAGFERPFGPPKTDLGTSASGLPRASITQVIHWLAHDQVAGSDTGAAALLVETRSLTVMVDEPAQEVALAWHAEFQVGPGAKNVTLSGASYNGLGLRLPPPFNLVARHQNSERTPYPTDGKDYVTRARWSAVSHELDGHPITVALFGQPSASRGLPGFFTMTQPFTYLAVTQGLDKAPLEYSAGDKFSLDYLLVVYAERKTPEFFDQRYRLWKP